MKELVALSFLFIISSCVQEEIDKASVTDFKISQSQNKLLYNIPYADSSELHNFKTDTDVINYKLARKLALIEIETDGFTKQLSWDGYKLSEYPVILYGFDSKPKFYDYIVLDAEGQEQGTVRVHSRRKSSGVLYRVEKNINDYRNFITKSGKGAKLFSDFGGNIFSGMITKSGESPVEVVDVKNGERLLNPTELSDEDILSEIKANLHSNTKSINHEIEEISNINTKNRVNQIKQTRDKTFEYDSIKHRMGKEHEYRDEYWKEIAKAKDSIMNTSDEQIVTKAKWGWFTDWFESYDDDDFYLTEYKNNLTGYYPKNEESSLWCGPYIMGWILHTKQNKYEYEHFLDYTTEISGTHPMFPWQMFWSMLEASDWEIWVLPWFTSGKRNGYWHIRDSKNPIVILTKWGTHWKVGYGSKRSGWKKWPNYYFACKDNGVIVSRERTSPYWQKASWLFLYLSVRD